MCCWVRVRRRGCGPGTGRRCSIWPRRRPRRRKAEAEEAAKEAPEAATALTNVAAEAAKAAVVNAGALPPLIALLSDGPAKAQEEAVKALTILAINADNKVAIAKARALPPLTALLGNSSDGAHEEAAEVRRNLMIGADNTRAIAKAGALSPLQSRCLATARRGMSSKIGAALRTYRSARVPYNFKDK